MAKAKTKKDNMDPIVDTPVASPAADPDYVLVGDAVPEDHAIRALRAKLETEIRAKIAAENRAKVDPGFIKPGVRTAFQEAISQTVVQSGGIPIEGYAAKPKTEYELAPGTIRQDY